MNKRILVILVIVTMCISFAMSMSVLAMAAGEIKAETLDIVCAIEFKPVENEAIETEEDEEFIYKSQHVEKIQVETMPTEEEVIQLSSVQVVPVETQEVIEETQAVDEDDPLRIVEVERREDGTRILEFKNGTYTIPNIPINGSADVSESGYVEKIVEVPHYLQQSYPYTNYGGHGTVSSHGCGVASIAMVYSYLLDRVILPDEIAENYGRYNTPCGSDWKVFSATAEDYGLTIESQTWKWNEVVEALENGKVVIANAQKDSIFTDSGHFIVFYGITEDGKVLVKDPNIYNYGVWSGKYLTEGFENGFDQKFVKYNCFPCWIYAPKDLEAIASMN